MEGDDDYPVYMVYTDEEGRKQLVHDITFQGDSYGYTVQLTIPYMHSTFGLNKGLHGSSLRHLTDEEWDALEDTNLNYERDKTCHPDLPLDLYRAGLVRVRHHLYHAPGALPFPVEFDD